MKFPKNFQVKSSKKYLKIFVGLYPALKKIYFDKSTNQIGLFSD